jgi:hypothetical protein
MFEGIQVGERRSITLESVASEGLQRGVQAFEIWHEDEIDCIFMRKTSRTLDKGQSATVLIRISHKEKFASICTVLRSTWASS